VARRTEGMGMSLSSRANVILAWAPGGPVDQEHERLDFLMHLGVLSGPEQWVLSWLDDRLPDPCLECGSDQCEGCLSDEPKLESDCA